MTSYDSLAAPARDPRPIAKQRGADQGDIEPATDGAAPQPIRDSDLRGTGWWLLEQITPKVPGDVRAASVGATLLRVLSALGPERASEEAALAEVELRGRIMHGHAPRTAAEWERAERAFGSDAIEEFHRWDLEDCLLEGDGVGEDDPLVGWQAADDDVEVAVVEGHEQRG